ncbi:MAG: hypothetical protein QOE96_815 [Blastocatellia bacterium]|jgi:hypothetical protein|nr:hypothetical protein [Blastocatellia bacterium]
MEQLERFIMQTSETVFVTVACLLLMANLFKFVLAEYVELARTIKKLMGYIGNYEPDNDSPKRKRDTQRSGTRRKR